MAVQIVAVYLLIVFAYLLSYLWRKLDGSGVRMRINPLTFLLCSVMIFILGAVFVYMLEPENALLAFAEAGGMVMSFSHPVFGVSFFVANLILRPWELLPENSLMLTLPKLMAGLALLSWMLFGLRRRGYSVIWNRACSLFIALLLWLMVAAIFSGSMAEGLDFHFSSFFPVLILVLMIVNVCYEPIDLEALRGTVIIAVTGVITSAIYATAYFPTQKGGGRLEGLGLLGNANDLGALIALVVPLLVFPLFIRKRSAGKVLAGLALCMILGLGLYWSQSRGAIMSLMAAGMAYFFVRFRLTAKSMAAIFGMVVVAMVFFSLIQRGEEDLEGSSSSRWNYAVTGFRMLKSNPIVGVGLNNYAKYYEAFTPAFTEWGNRTAHSSWVLVMAEAGLPGLVLFIALYVTVLKAGWRAREEVPEFFLAMVSYGVAMSFLSHTFTFIPYLLFALVLAAARIYKPVEAQQQTGTAKEARSGARRARMRAMLVFSAALLPAREASASRLILEGAPYAQKPIADSAPATSRTIEIRGARGETLDFLLRLSGDGCGRLSEPRFETADLGFRIFAMPPVRTEHPSFPGAFVGWHLDPLVPVEDGELCGGGELSAWYWGEIAIPSDAGSGTHQATIGLEGAQPVSLSVQVWRMQMPDRHALPAYSEITTWFNMLGHLGGDGEGEALLARRYEDEMLAHRLIPIKCGIKVPKVLSGSSGPRLDIDGYPDPSLSFRRSVLEKRPAWALFDLPTTAYYNLAPAEVREYYTAIENTLPSIAEPGRAFTYLWDEPKRSEMPRLLDLARLVSELAPSLKVMVTTTPTPELEPYVDIFAPVMNDFAFEGRPALDVYRRLQRDGKEVWWYVSCLSHGCDANLDRGTPDMVIDRPAAYVRSIAWLSERYGIDAFLYYHVNNGYQFHPRRDPWNSLWDFSGNGDGTLFYPARPGERGFGEHGPIGSVRLKLWRQASFDAEYLAWMREVAPRPEWWPGALESVAASITAWDRDYQSYQAIRDRIGSFLDARLSG